MRWETFLGAPAPPPAPRRVLYVRFPGAQSMENRLLAGKTHGSV